MMQNTKRVVVYTKNGTPLDILHSMLPSFLNRGFSQKKPKTETKKTEEDK